MVRNIIIILILVPLAIVFFAPKRELYYLMEQKLQDSNIIISSEQLDTTPLGIDASHPVFYASGMPVATAEGFNIWSILFTTHFNARGVKIAEGFPQELVADKLGISNMIFTPFDLSIDGVSSLGNLNGNINLGDRVVRIDVDTKKVPKYYNSYFKKSDEGVYYESNF